ncbi:MAG: hypothetical protein KAS32_24220 [Candidatus Peribacteraceae bacterium]|nr:hypothetical protein [Candidatus Peribacteraceae bacterium]
MVYQSKMVAAIRCNGKILRELSDTVQLPFGSEYSVRLKNLSTRKAALSITIDGTDILDGHKIILGPDESTDIERFITNNNLYEGRKLKFIEKTEEISNHRGNKMEDGLVEIEYQYEQIRFSRPVLNDYHSFWSNPIYGPPYYRSSPPMFGANQITCQSASSNVDTEIQCSAINLSTESPIGDVTATAFRSAVQNDAGITVQGSESKQEFEHGYIGSLESTKHKIVIQLKGTDGKGEVVSEPVLVKTKKTCSSCGRKWASKYEYCPKDGTFLG